MNAYTITFRLRPRDAGHFAQKANIAAETPDAALAQFRALREGAEGYAIDNIELVLPDLEMP